MLREEDMRMRIVYAQINIFNDTSIFELRCKSTCYDSLSYVQIPTAIRGLYLGASTGQLADPGEVNTRREPQRVQCRCGLMCSTRVSLAPNCAHLVDQRIAGLAVIFCRLRSQPSKPRTGRQICKGFAMQAALSSTAALTTELRPQQFPAIDVEERPTVPTAQAAYYLNRRPQTLRDWACKETGPLRPIRVHGLLAWPMAEIRRVLGVSQ